MGGIVVPNETNQYPLNLRRLIRGLAINVLSYNENPVNITDGEVFKNPFVDIIYRSKREGQEIHLLLLENGNLYYI